MIKKLELEKGRRDDILFSNYSHLSASNTSTPSNEIQIKRKHLESNNLLSNSSNCSESNTSKLDHLMALYQTENSANVSTEQHEYAQNEQFFSLERLIKDYKKLEHHYEKVRSELLEKIKSNQVSAAIKSEIEELVEKLPEPCICGSLPSDTSNESNILESSFNHQNLIKDYNRLEEIFEKFWHLLLKSTSSLLSNDQNEMSESRSKLNSQIKL